MKRLLATVIAAASSDEKLAIAQQAGADELINYSDGELKEKVKALTDGQGNTYLVNARELLFDAVGDDDGAATQFDGCATANPLVAFALLLCLLGRLAGRPNHRTVLWLNMQDLHEPFNSLNGSFFEDLCREDLRLVWFPGFAGPGIAVPMTLS